MIQLGNNPLKGSLCSTRTEEEKTWFFAEGQAGTPLIRRAKEICNSGCPVKQECLESALSVEVHGERFGVYGGMSARERDRSYPSWFTLQGLCRNGLHRMSDPENQIAREDGVRCRACKNEWQPETLAVSA